MRPHRPRAGDQCRIGIIPVLRGVALSGSPVAKSAYRTPVRLRARGPMQPHAPPRPASDAPTTDPPASLARCGRLARPVVRRSEVV